MSSDPNAGVPPGAPIIYRNPKKKKNGAAPTPWRKKLRKQAMNDIRWSFDPVLDQLARTEDLAKDDYREAQQGVNTAYQALNNQLAPLGGQYDAQAQAIQADLAQRLQGLTGMIGQTPGAENAAAAGAFAGLGAGGQQLLASDRMRNLGYHTSTQRQAGLDANTIRSQFLEDYKDLIADLRAQKLDVKGDFQEALMARLDDLRQRRWERKIAEKEYELRKSEIEDAQQFRDEQADEEQRRHRDDEQEEEAARDYVRSEAERKYDAKKIKPIRKDIEAIQDKIQSLSKQIEQLGQEDAWNTAATTERERLIKRRKNLSRKIRRKKGRIHDIKKTEQL